MEAPAAAPSTGSLHSMCTGGGNAAVLPGEPGGMEAAVAMPIGSWRCPPLPTAAAGQRPRQHLGKLPTPSSRPASSPRPVTCNHKVEAAMVLRQLLVIGLGLHVVHRALLLQGQAPRAEGREEQPYGRVTFPSIQNIQPQRSRDVVPGAPAQQCQPMHHKMVLNGLIVTAAPLPASTCQLLA